jgi:hypothetical protein
MRGQRHAPAAIYPRENPVPIVQEAGWAPGPVWTGAENLAPTGIRSPDCPARSSVAIPTELPSPLIVNKLVLFSIHWYILSEL